MNCLQGDLPYLSVSLGASVEVSDINPERFQLRPKEDLETKLPSHGGSSGGQCFKLCSLTSSSDNHLLSLIRANVINVTRHMSLARALFLSAYVPVLPGEGTNFGLERRRYREPQSTCQ